MTAERPISRKTASEIIQDARRRAELGPFTWHDLHHHHASVLLPAGISPALVADRLGHTVGTLMQTYADVVRSEEDRVRAVVDSSLAGTAEDWLRTRAAGA